MKDNERTALADLELSAKENKGRVVACMGGAFTFSMMVAEDGSKRLSATPLPPSRVMRTEDWQFLDDALLFFGLPEGVRAEEVGPMRHWRWT